MKSLSGAEKALVRSNALRALDVKRHPTIGYRSDEIVATDGGYRLAGSLAIHGKTHPRAIDLQVTDLGDTWRLTSDSVVRQSEFGVKPYSLMMGSLRVADDVTVSFSANLGQEMTAVGRWRSDGRPRSPRNVAVTAEFRQCGG